MATFLLGTACVDAATAPTSVDPPRFAESACTLSRTADELQALFEEIDDLAASGALTSGQAEALRHHLLNVLRNLDAGNVCAAMNQLAAFGQLVGNFVNAGILTPAEAAPILVGNTAPTVVIDAPVEGGLFAFGESIPFSITVTDPDDGVVDCNLVEVTFVLGHDDHGHPQDMVNGCNGVLSTNAADVSHGGNVFGIIVASYTDLGGPDGSPALTRTAQVIIRQKRQEVEFVAVESGTGVAVTNDPAGGGLNRASLSDGDWIALNGSLDLVNIESLGFRVGSTSSDIAAGSPMAEVEIRLDAINGPILATAALTSTGDATSWETQDVALVDPGGSHKIYLVFRSVPGGQTGDDLFTLNWVEFGGTGIAQ
jgi:hypothetical protein